MSDLSAIVPEWRNLSLDEIAERLARLPKEARDEIVNAAMAATAHMRWLPNSPGPQLDAYHSKADILLYGGAAGGGKASRISSLVLTPFGWKAIGDLRVGSRICAVDGTVTEVIGVYPQGVQDIYRVTMRDGGSCEVTGDHLWLAWATHKNVKIGNVITCGSTSRRLYTTEMLIKEMAAPGRSDGRGRGFAIPVAAPVALNVAGQLRGAGNFIDRAIDPYLLGLLIGDGSITEGARISTGDEETVDWVCSLVGDDVAVDRAEGRAVSLRFRGGFLVDLRQHLIDVGLYGKKAADKHIPRQYLMAPTEARWRLLRGLMDTDGWVEPKRACYFTTVSKRLADDFVFLARSLGAVTSMTDKSPTFTYLGELKDGQPAYCVRLRIQNPQDCFTLSRKKEIAREIEHQSEGRFIEKIEHSGRDEAVCIQVSHPSSLYITDDFIVTHNTQLILGLAMTAHSRSLIMRNEFNSLSDLTEKALAINGTRAGFNGSPPPTLRTVDGKFIQFTGAVTEKFQGVDFDYKAFDECVQLDESVVRFHLAWVRTSDRNQRTRVVMATNPPVSSQGDWVIGMFRPWLDITHHNPAKAGELRFFAKAPDGQDVEVDDATPHLFPGEAKPVRPMSRTFIPAMLKDNPYYVGSSYEANLDNLDEPLRSAMRDGNFMAARQDQDHQVLPVAWLRAAVKRWTPEVGKEVQMTAMAADVGDGGADRVTLACRHAEWYAPIIAVPGKEAPDGSSQAALIVQHRRDRCGVVIDMGGGYGGRVAERLKDNEIVFTKYNGSGASTGRAKDGRMFINMRAQAWWRFREALDPDQNGGSQVALPDDPGLISELSSVCFYPDIQKIQVEDKKEVRKRLGRSPDKADAVVMAWAPGDTAVKRGRFGGGAGGSERPTRGNLGYSGIKSSFSK